MQSTGVRMAALEKLQILDTPPELEFDQIVELAANVCNTKMAAISFVTDERQWFKAAINIGITQTPINQSFCAEVVARNGPLIIEDARKNTILANFDLVTGVTGIRFYAGVPIHAPDGTTVGAICVIDQSIRPDGLSDAQLDALKILANQIERLLELRTMLRQRDQLLAEHQAISAELSTSLLSDTLTGINNRAAFQLALENSVAHHAESGAAFALLLFDLDHFKQVNDALGHAAGDQLLKDFSSRLTLCINSDDTIARLGGDEFAIILRSIKDERTLRAKIDGILNALNDPMHYEGRSVYHRQSIGISVFPDHASNAEELYQYSDLALLEAKSARKNFVFFENAMAVSHRENLSLLGEAKAALEKHWIQPFYQPKINLRTGRINGFEALARLPRADSSAEHRALFKVIFGDAELSRLLTDAMTSSVLKDIQAWDAMGLDYGHIAINTSSHDFSDDFFGERLLEKLKAHNVHPSSIQIEITETVLLARGQSHVFRAIQLLSDAGVKIALDDFGTGHASLVHLKELPVHSLKIDRSFIKNIEDELNDTAIVEAILYLGHSLGIEIVAEGIETINQLKKMRGKGCDVGQGFLFGKAVPNDEVDDIIRANLYLAA